MNLTSEEILGGNVAGIHTNDSPFIGYQNLQCECSPAHFYESNPNRSAIAKVEIPTGSTIIRPRRYGCIPSRFLRTNQLKIISINEANKPFSELMPSSCRCYSDYIGDDKYVYKTDDIINSEKFNNNPNIENTYGLYFFGTPRQ